MTDRMKLHDAIIFATKAHQGQKRKGTDIDYICHPLEVAQILTEIVDRGTDWNDELIIAGLLHDVVEDTDVGIDEIRERFGSDVARLVGAHTHPKDGTWIERKMKEVNKIKHADPQVKALVLADKVSNMRSIRADVQEQGNKVWDRFNAGVEDQRTFYNAILDALEELQHYRDVEHIYWEATELFKDIFVKYYYDEANDAILQGYPGNYAKLERGKSFWNSIDELPAYGLKEISRYDAEHLEEWWWQATGEMGNKIKQ